MPAEWPPCTERPTPMCRPPPLQVSPSTVATVRDALLQAGEQGVWQPLGLDPFTNGPNNEVNEALQQLLDPRSFRVRG